MTAVATAAVVAAVALLLLLLVLPYLWLVPAGGGWPLEGHPSLDMPL